MLVRYKSVNGLHTAERWNWDAGEDWWIEHSGGHVGRASSNEQQGASMPENLASLDARGRLRLLAQDGNMTSIT